MEKSEARAILKRHVNLEKRSRAKLHKLAMAQRAEQDVIRMLEQSRRDLIADLRNDLSVIEIADLLNTNTTTVRRVLNQTMRKRGQGVWVDD